MIIGMIIGLSGVDSFMTKSATITNLPRAYNMSTLRHSVSAMVRVAVTVEDARHLQKLVEGLRRLSRSDQIAQVNYTINTRITIIYYHIDHDIYTNYTTINKVNDIVCYVTHVVLCYCPTHHCL
jgi:translation elongation factor EF-G